MRNSILNSALNVSMEGLDPLESAEINPLTEQTIVEVDEVLEDARTASAVVDQHDEAVEDLSQAADSLESLVSSLEDAIADGGMSPQSADIHSRALAIATRRLPIDSDEFTVSNESFGGTGDKLQASMEALEGVKALLSKIWEAIRSAVLSAWAAVKAFFASIGNSGPAVVAAGQSLKKKALESKGLTPTVATINLGGALNYVVIDGKTDPAKALEAINTGYDVGVRNYTNKIVAALNPMYQAIQRGEVTPERLAAVAKGVDVEACLTDTMQGKLPGGYYFEILTSKKEGLDALAESSIKLVQDPSKKVTKAEIDMPTVDEISSLADKVITMGKLIITSKAVAGMAEKGINDAVKAGNALVKQGDSLDKAEVASAKAILGKLNKAANLCTGCSHQYLSFMGSAAKASVAFGAKVLNAYGKAAKKAEKAATK